ncbi:MAG: hypothetical protein JSV23_04390 [Promethearchaeota archaeon]|nr:MAG: hypothetical protein JSV23_04390 [Candidatus Lokiarchaeota archaeon]
MDSIIYKVIFKADTQFENKNLTLSFINLEFEKPISIPDKFITELKKLSEPNPHIINLQNIEEVLIIGNPTVDYTYNYYLVVLYTTKSDGKKIGYLIGNVKKVGNIIIGVWPFNIQLKEITAEIVLETYNNIIENPNKYSNICLITQ